MPRLAGVDVARALAVFGMFAVHVGPSPHAGGARTALHAFDGRASALFALLAGLSLALVSGRARVTGRPLGTGDADREATRLIVRISVRSALLLIVGMWLAGLDTGVLVILSFYAVYFMVALPFLWLPARVIAVVAVVWAVAGPLLSYALRGPWGLLDDTRLVPELGARGDPFGTLTVLTVTGAYPALTWMPYVLAGVAAGRLALEHERVAGRLAVAGAALAVAGYGGSWLAVNVLGGAGPLTRAAAGIADTGHPVTSVLASRAGTVPANDPVWLLVAEGHTGTPFEIAGATGVALAVLGLCLLACRTAGGRVLTAPLAAAGALPLTVYVAHLVAIDRWFDPGPDLNTWAHLAQFVLVATAAAWLWREVAGRGPLERALHLAAGAAARQVGRG